MDLYSQIDGNYLPEEYPISKYAGCSVEIPQQKEYRVLYLHLLVG